MKQSVSENMFIESFRNMGRMETSEQSGNFTYEALQALFDYLEEMEAETDVEFELDPIALCCDFTQYGSAMEAATEYGEEFETDEDAAEYLRDHTTLIEFDDGIIIQNF